MGLHRMVIKFKCFIIQSKVALSFVVTAQQQKKRLSILLEQKWSKFGIYVDIGKLSSLSSKKVILEVFSKVIKRVLFLFLTEVVMKQAKHKSRTACFHHFSIVFHQMIVMSVMFWYD